MINAERERLRLVKTLISNAKICIELWEDEKSNMHISCTSCNPEGVAYFTTTASLLCLFVENKINLQTLLNNSPFFIVEIVGEAKTALYSMRDVEIQLSCGDQTLHQLTGDTPWEIWHC